MLLTDLCDLTRIETEKKNHIYLFYIKILIRKFVRWTGRHDKTLLLKGIDLYISNCCFRSFKLVW